MYANKSTRKNHICEIVALDGYRRRRQTEQRLKSGQGIDMDDIVGRDYGTLGDAVHGVLRLRTIFERHVPGEFWSEPLLALLDRANALTKGWRPERVEALKDACLDLEAVVEEHLHAENRLDLGAAVVILRLMATSSRSDVSATQ